MKNPKSLARHEELLKDGIVTFSEAAVLLSCSLRTVERLVYDGYLPRTRVRSAPRIPLAAIRQYLIDNLVEATK